MRPQVGNVIHNKYRLLRLIGDGGMGSVFEARHEVLGTTVALKFLHVELSRRQGLVQRFLQEARVSAQIQSANVVRVTDVDQTATGLAFIVMELLEGKTLQSLYEELYRAGQRLSYADALEYAMQMLEGVAAAHRTGIVHRDLKPDNVMITKGGKGDPAIKLLDFGIAKLRVAGAMERGLTRPGVIMGTPEYMAPEQAYSADAVDSRADIFSLGVIIFEMLAGRRPVGGDEPQQIASAYLAGHVAELTELFPECPVDLANAVHKAMAPLAKDRFASADAMRSAIEPFYTAIRPPPVSVHAAHPSLSFARLTPVPSASSTPAAPSNAPTGSSRERELDLGRARRAEPATPTPREASSQRGAASSPPPVQAKGGTSAMPAAAPSRPRSEASASARVEALDSGPAAARALDPGRYAARPVTPRAVPSPAPSGGAPVAKTAPPQESDALASDDGIDGSCTAADDLPPIASSVPSRQPTPLGGFLPIREATAAAAVVAAEVKAKASAAPQKAPAPAPSRPKAAGAARIPATAAGPDESAHVRAPVVVSARLAPAAAEAASPAPKPVVQAAAAGASASAARPVNGAGTAEARPLFTAGGLGAGTAEAAPLFAEPELGAGTVAMDEPYVGDAGSTSAPSDGDLPPGATVGAFVDPLASAPVPSAAAPLPATKRSSQKTKKKSKGVASLAFVLLLATGATAAVVGGVYAAQRMSRVEDCEDTHVPVSAPAPVRVDPGPAPGPAAEPASTAPPPPVAPGPRTGPRTYPPRAPGHPAVPGSSRPVAPPSAQPPQPQVPPGLPPFVMPTLPFPFPGQAPASPQTQPQPSSDTPHRHGGRPPLVPIPRPGGDYAPNAYWAEPPPYFRASKL